MSFYHVVVMKSDDACAPDDPVLADAEGSTKPRKCPPKHFTRFTHGLYSAGVLRNLSEMRKKEEFCDVTLKALT